MHLRCIAIDDEPFALGVIEEYCSKVDFLHLDKTFDSGLDAINFIKTNPVDLIFLDIEMRELTGLKFMEMVTPLPMVIFTTAYDQYAVKSYEYNVLDYLLKPIPFDRFVMAASKALDQQKKRSEGLPAQVSEVNDDFFFVKSGYATVKINFSDIHYIEGQRDYLLVRTDREKIMINQTFAQLEKVFPLNQFLRVHKSYIIALDKIQKIERFRLRILDCDIPVGEFYKNDFLKAIKEKSI